jgi:hypothetical protein
MSQLRIQYVSNLHTHNLNRVRIKPVAPYLAICGNIGNTLTRDYVNFVDHITHEYEKVYFVPGLVDYMHQDIETVELFFKDLEVFNPNFKVLNNKSDVIGSTRIIGSTLWPNINALTYLYDTSLTLIKKDNTTYLTPNSLKLLHEKDKYYISKSLENTSLDTVVISHFSPSFILNSDNPQSYIPKQVMPNFASNFHDFFKPPVKAWITGIIDTSDKIYINEIPLLVNSMNCNAEEHYIDID